MGDVQVLHERTPDPVGTKRDVSEAHRAAVMLRQQGEMVGCIVCGPLGPYGESVRQQVTIEVAIGIHAAVVAPPAIRVDPRDSGRIARLREAYADFFLSVHGWPHGAFR